MPYTYFLIATEVEIEQIKSVDDVFSHIEKTEPLFGGDISLEAISNLTKIFIDGEKSVPIKTKYVWKDNSQFYILNSELCEKVASTEWDDILQASVPWSESEPWKSIEHNRMDLAGMIIDVQLLCKQTNKEKSLYFLLSNED